MPKLIHERFDSLIKSVLAEYPEYGAFRVRNAVAEAARKEQIPEDELPSQRTFDKKVAFIKGDETVQKEITALRRVQWPESFGTEDLPWQSAVAVLDFLEVFPRLQINSGLGFGLLMDGQTRPTIRAAKWYWRLFLAAPEAPIDKRALMACMAAFTEVTKLGKFKYLYTRDLEDWLLFRPYPREGIPEEQTKVAIANYLASNKNRKGWVEQEDIYPNDDSPPTSLELLELGISQDQWNAYQDGTLKEYVEENNA